MLVGSGLSDREYRRERDSRAVARFDSGLEIAWELCGETHDMLVLLACSRHYIHAESYEVFWNSKVGRKHVRGVRESVGWLRCHNSCYRELVPPESILLLLDEALEHARVGRCFDDNCRVGISENHFHINRFVDLVEELDEEITFFLRGVDRKRGTKYAPWGKYRELSGRSSKDAAKSKIYKSLKKYGEQSHLKARDKSNKVKTCSNRGKKLARKKQKYAGGDCDYDDDGYSLCS